MRGRVSSMAGEEHREGPRLGGAEMTNSVATRFYRYLRKISNGPCVVKTMKVLRT